MPDNKLTSFVDVLNRSMKNSIELSARIPFDAKNPVHFTFVCLYGSIIDIAHGLAVCVKNDCYSAVPILLRSALEAYVNLLLIHSDPDYVASMHHHFHKEWSKRLVAAENNNPYLKEILESSEYDIHKKEIEARISQEKLNNIKSMTIKDKFEKCGLMELYRSVYSFLSDHAHSNIGALINRHMRYVDGNICVEFLSSPSIEQYDVYVSTISEILIQSGIVIHRRFATSAEGALTANLAQLAELIGNKDPE